MMEAILHILIDSDIGQILSFLRLIHKLKEILDRISLKKELSEILEKTLDKARHSFNTFLENFSICLGASIVGLITEPLVDPERKAKELVSNLEKSYEQSVNDMKELVKYLDAHKDEFRKVFGKEWLAIEAVIKAFENEEPDWNFLLHHKKIDELMAKEMKKEKKFIRELNKNIESFNKKLGLESFVSEVRDSYKFLQSDEFWKEFIKLVKKYQSQTNTEVE